MTLRHALREMQELGLGRTLFRIGWEARLRSGWMSARAPGTPHYDPSWCDDALARALPFGHPSTVRAAGVVDADALRALRDEARAAARGSIRCFSRWTADFGHPIDWFRNPLNGARWDDRVHWSRVPIDDARGDVKVVWEVARFPHAYAMARAAAHDPSMAAELGAALAAQIDSFIEANPFGIGVHWASGYEIALRSFAWLFALHVFQSLGAWDETMRQRVLAAVYRNAIHVDAYLDFAEQSCFNDHLIGEALLLAIAGALAPRSPQGERWASQGRRILDEQADVQIFDDGGYLLYSHTYHRAVLQMYALATMWCGERAPWRDAMSRSIDFLRAQQNPDDGRLPNFGSNDGGVPFIGTSCDYTDFRPVLQSAGDGPWSEEEQWLGGRPGFSPATSEPTRSFPTTGLHVIRGADPGSFAVFRCGRVRSRFPQIDMLHVDLWWRGVNVLADAGTYVYNGAPRWQEHFFRTGAHNTVCVDGVDQMLHYRRFKVLYWTDARLLELDDRAAAGEHYGYRQNLGVVHRRAIAYHGDDLWVVTDTILGEGEHDLRLHWLGGIPYFRFDAPHRLTLETDRGPFCVAAYDGAGQPLEATVVAGADEPPRGWLSRYYGEKIAVPSFVVAARRALPFTMISVLSAGRFVPPPS